MTPRTISDFQQLVLSSSNEDLINYYGTMGAVYQSSAFSSGDEIGTGDDGEPIYKSDLPVMLDFIQERALNNGVTQMQLDSAVLAGNTDMSSVPLSTKNKTTKIVGGIIGGLAFLTTGILVIKYNKNKKFLSNKYVQYGIGTVVTVGGILLGTYVAPKFKPVSTKEQKQ